MESYEYSQQSKGQRIGQDVILSGITGFVALTLFGLDTLVHKGLGVLFAIAFVFFFKRLVETIREKK